MAALLLDADLTQQFKQVPQYESLMQIIGEIQIGQGYLCKLLVEALSCEVWPCSSDEGLPVAPRFPVDLLVLLKGNACVP